MKLPSPHYARCGTYRRPPAWDRAINRIAARLAALGLTPRNTVTLVVRGRRSGEPRSKALTCASYQGDRYLVSLAGESEWVRNVRAAGGHALIHHGSTHRVRLEEIPVAERPPIIRAYLARWALTTSPKRAARDYFGLGPNPTLEEIAIVADRYPVFRIAPLAA